MTTRLKSKVTYESQLTTVKLVGPIDEHVADVLDDLKAQVRTPRVRFDCEGVSLINSIGAASWMAYLRDFQNLEVTFVRCSTAFTSLCLIMPDLIGTGTVESLYMTYYCATCDQEAAALLERDKVKTEGIPLLKCDTCKQVMAIDPDDADFAQVVTGTKTS